VPLTGALHVAMGAFRGSLRGHPFMTSTRRWEGVRLRWTHADGGSEVGSMWTST